MTNPTDISLDDFTAAKEIFEKLRDLPSDRQHRVLRWVAEGLGLMSVVGAQPPTVPPSSVPPAPPASPSMQDPLRRGGAVHSDIKSFVLQKGVWLSL